MFQVVRFGKVLGTVLGNRDLAKTKQNAVAKFGNGVTLKRVI
jgi:hypothetical protein